MKVVIMGVPGCGKTTICERVRKEGNIQFITFGTIMFEVAQDQYGIKDRDAMRRELGPDDYRKVQYEAARRIGAMKGDVLIDTHASIKTKYGYYPGLPRKVLESIAPDVLALIELDPAVIIQRREKDINSGARVGRDHEEAEGIELHQMMNRHFVTAYAAIMSCFVAYLHLTWHETRPYEHTDFAVNALLDIFKGKT